MSVQFNLLPSVKLEYVKARRNKRITMLAASMLAITMIVVTVILFLVVQVFQKKYSRDLSADIATESSRLQDTADLNKILTIQNQLGKLNDLHATRPAATRLFGFVTQVTPANVKIATLGVDFEGGTMNLSGTANEISTVNQFVDTLKFTTYKVNDTEVKNAFSEVVLSGFSRGLTGTAYQITLKFDPIIFYSTKEVTLTVPANKITTRSETEKPENLFQTIEGQ